MLDIECFTYLNRALESTLSPIVILASNRGQSTIRGTDNLISAHGIPPDLIPRLLIVPTHAYTSPEIRQIVATRARLEYSTAAPPSLASGAGTGVGGPSNAGVQGLVQTMTLATDALDELTAQGERVSLRYALQLLAPAGILARCRGSEGNVVQGADVREAVDLFLDAGRSAVLVRDPATGGGFIS